MRKERTPDQTAEVALRAADESTARLMEGLRRQSREDVLATLLAAGLYAEGAAMARKMGFDESHVHDLLVEVANVNEDDQGMVSESVWNLESLLELV
jgi:hypothetical protein